MYASPSAYRMRVRTKEPGPGGAVKIRKIGIDDGPVSYAAQQDTLRGIVVLGTVQPGSIDDDVICGAGIAHQHEIHNSESGCACDLEANEAIVICTRRQSNRSRIPGSQVIDSR